MKNETSLGMRIATVQLESASPFCQSRFHNTPKLKSETPDIYEQRTWKEKGHWDEKGQLYIPPFAFKNCISSAAKYLSVQKKGQATWTKNFEAGILIINGLTIPVTRETIKQQDIFCSPTGKPGASGGTRVMRSFPIVHEWSGALEVYVTDPTIPEDVFAQVVDAAGKFVGIGSFRVANRGIFGRFSVKNISWPATN